MTEKKIKQKSLEEKPRVVVTMATDGEIVTSPVKTTREIYMKAEDDKKDS